MPEEFIDADYSDVPDQKDTVSRDLNGFTLVPDSIPIAYMDASRRTPDHSFKRYLGHIERMAGQGMEPEQIAHRLGLDPQKLIDAAETYPDVRLAFTGGRSRMVDEMSFTLQQNALRGNSGDAKFLLQTKGDFTPKSKVDNGNLPQNGVAPIDIGGIEKRLQDQRGR